MTFPASHGDKLRALLNNEKLPSEEKLRINAAVENYAIWLDQLLKAQGATTEELVGNLVSILNQYRLYVDINLIFDSPTDFLYRQKGQLKLDNSVIEEFLPILVYSVFSRQLEGKDIAMGPTTCFSGIRFESALPVVASGAGMTLRAKDQDFAMSRRIYLQASHHPDFSDQVTIETNVAYLAAECKTNRNYPLTSR